MPLRFDIVTIFPGFFAGPLEHGIVRRAREAGLVDVHIHDLREATHDRHRTVDDRPFGGGEGMVLKPEPIFDTVERILSAPGEPREAAPRATAIVLLSAAGKLFRQETARRLAGLERIILLCGRYEGVDERVAEHLATDEISIGDFIVSGGELPAALVLDAATRLVPGALGNESSSANESFTVAPGVDGASAGAPREGSARAAGGAGGILECPHYTRPQEYRGWGVPDVLMSGHHEEVRRWRRRTALAKTLRNRPDLFESAALSDEDLAILDELRSAR
ncbi:MAG TPA: tRNA (guanosine(37)-N1)-methyltransferase TrmD [Candidatus Acidoferrales bacterium]|nr:tRNA (guanosine(37)-N1)-methyltransferase TrmD [Candidatus Acidoferrales bacterium]